MEFFIPDSDDVSFAVDIVSNGQILNNTDTIPILLHEERLQRKPNTIIASLYDERDILISSYVIEKYSLGEPELPGMELGDLALVNGIYSFHIELFQDEESLGTTENWFFYSQSDVRLNRITIAPHSVRINTPVTVTLDIGTELEQYPYIQVWLNDQLLYQELLSDYQTKFEIKAPSIPGLYDIVIDIYPWFDNRITDSIDSSNQYNVELLVLDEDAVIENSEEHHILASDALSIDENFLFYNDEQLSFSIDINGFSTPEDAEDAVFEIGDGFFSFTLAKDEDVLQLGLRLSNGEFGKKIETRDLLQQVSITVLEGEEHVTLLVFHEERLLYGEIIYYEFFAKPISDQDSTVLEKPILYGLKTQNLGGLVITATDEGQDSAFKQVLRGQRGNFILYAEGFEFSKSPYSNVGYSEGVYLDRGYLVVPPAAQVQLPSFALDDHTVDIEITFRQEDNLAGLNLVFYQMTDSVQHALFSISEQRGLVDDARYLLNDIVLNPSLSFSLRRQDSRLILSFQGNTFLLPVLPRGLFQLHVQNEIDIKERTRVESNLHIDSVLATNEPSEFIDRVLDVLP